MKIHFEVEDYPKAITTAVTDLIETANEGFFAQNLELAHFEELKDFVALALGVVSVSRFPLQRVSIECPKFSRITSWGTYTFSDWSEDTYARVRINVWLLQSVQSDFQVVVQELGCIGPTPYVAIKFVLRP